MTAFVGFHRAGWYFASQRGARTAIAKSGHGLARGSDSWKRSGRLRIRRLIHVELYWARNDQIRPSMIEAIVVADEFPNHRTVEKAIKKRGR